MVQLLFEKVRVTTGIPYLDALTQGGFIKGTTNLIIGPAGAGKTICGLHFLLDGAHRNENGLLVAMQEFRTKVDYNLNKKPNLNSFLKVYNRIKKRFDVIDVA